MLLMWFQIVEPKGKELWDWLFGTTGEYEDHCGLEKKIKMTKAGEGII